MIKILSKNISHSSTPRPLESVKYIVIHYTGNIGDTAENNCKYFSPEGGNTRQAGAHIFVDRAGNCIKSIPLKYAAWAVGGDHRTGKKGEAKYYKECTNFNSVSIELCDIVDKYPSEAQIKATKKAIKHIKKYCKNANIVIRHYDVNGKICPESMVYDSAAWKRFKKDIGVK